MIRYINKKLQKKTLIKLAKLPYEVIYSLKKSKACALYFDHSYKKYINFAMYTF